MSFSKRLLRTWKEAWNTKTHTVTSVDIDSGEPELVWDIEMPEHHNFFANGVLAHNCHKVNWRDCLEKEPKTSYGKIIKHITKLNPRVVIIGVTGTPFRGIEHIKGPFWQDQIGQSIDREFLVDGGYIVPTVFGFGDTEYDLGDFAPKNELGTDDFTSAELAEMDAKISTDTTAKIMREVVEIMKGRNMAMITCASERHCKDAARHLPVGSYGIITQSTRKKERKAILDDAKTGKIKYLLQIGCLTTGLNRPLIDTSVILRRIGSLTLLIQLLGRGMRLLKQEHIEAGVRKIDHLVLDYSGTMEVMGAMYDNPILAEAVEAKDQKEKRFKSCPKCGAENGEHARRCNGVDAETGERCEHFFSSKECEDLVRGGIVISKGCGAENDSTARECRKCGNLLIDYDKNLSGKHYTDADWKNVTSMDFKPTKNGGLMVLIGTDSYGVDGNQEVAKMFFNPWASAGAKKMWRVKFVNTFVNGYQWQNRIMGMPNNIAVIKNKAMFDIPRQITHRINDKNQSVVNGVRFSTRTIKGGKRVDSE